MAEETLRPNANGDNSECMGSDSNQTDNYQLVDEASANDSDYVHSNGLNSWTLDLYGMPDTAIPTGSTINKITFYARLSDILSASYASCKFAYKSGGTTYYSSAITVSTSWAQKSWEQTTNQKTSAAWTIDDINALQAGVSLYQADKAAIGMCSQLWIVIDYTEAALNQTIIIF